MKHLLRWALLGLTLTTACKSSDPSPSSGNSSTTGGTTTPTPAAKSHQVTLMYQNAGLDNKSYNYGAGIRLFVDGKPLPGSSAQDTTYYISSFDAPAPIAYPKTYTVTGSELRVELRLENVYGTPAQPLDKSKKPLACPYVQFAALPQVDGKDITASLVNLGNGSKTQTLPYDNGRNPSAIVKIDLTKL